MLVKNLRQRDIRGNFQAERARDGKRTSIVAVSAGDANASLPYSSWYVLQTFANATFRLLAKASTPVNPIHKPCSSGPLYSLDSEFLVPPRYLRLSSSAQGTNDGTRPT